MLGYEVSVCFICSWYIGVSYVDESAGHSLFHTANSNGEVGQSSSAGEDVTALGGRVLGTADLGVVGTNNGGVGVDEGGASVDDTVNGRPGGGGTDTVRRRGKAPEALAVVGGDIGDRTSVFGGVDVALIMKLAFVSHLIFHHLDIPKS
jgi:hypothetical protein